MTQAIDVVTITKAEYNALVDEHDDLQKKLMEALRWKAAVDDAGVVHWTLTDETVNDPRKAIGALLDTVSNIALDPAVSRDAAKLRDTHLHRAETAERELEAAKRDTELLWANCRVIYFPDPAGSYPLEHNFRWVGKDSRTDIEAALRIDAARKERT